MKQPLPSLTYSLILSLALTLAPKLSPSPAAWAQGQRLSRAQKDWLKPLKDARKAHAKALSKARDLKDPKARQKQLRSLWSAWIVKVQSEAQRALKESQRPQSKIQEFAKQQLKSLRLELYRTCLDQQRPRLARRFEAELLSDAQTRDDCLRLKRAWLRATNPKAFHQFIQERLRVAVPKGQITLMKGQVSLRSTRQTLLWLWSPNHPLALHELALFRRLAKKHKLRLLLIQCQKPHSKQALTAPKDSRMLREPKKIRQSLLLDSWPWLLHLDRKGQVLGVNDSASELDQRLKDSP